MQEGDSYADRYGKVKAEFSQSAKRLSYACVFSRLYHAYADFGCDRFFCITIFSGNREAMTGKRHSLSEQLYELEMERYEAVN